MVDERALALAFHESGHAVAAVCLGNAVEAVTIAGGRTHAGLTLWWSETTDEARALLKSGGRDADRDLFLRARGRLEQDVMITLAGDVAEALGRLEARWLATTRRGELRKSHAGTVQRAPVLERHVEALAGRDEDRVHARERAASEADDHQEAGLDPGSDEAAAWAGILALNPDHDPRTLGAHLAYLRAATRTLLEREWEAVEALAGALVEHETLSGLAATLIIGAHRS
ncbi:MULTISPECIES: hypothetical protein [unclassified Nocardioides]|uniref:hypothetical protein n=1 Tax=unclassified Nocardioides TaxID=2615069 RepID=UPI0002DC39DC|nr:MULTISPECIES: hypothetical protein [unclassified Nocardioides]